jgi:hypothetical protein
MSWRQEGRRAPAKVETSAEKLGVGGHLDDTCGKCKRVTSHVVLAKVGTKPTRVECRVCHSAHAYRSGEPASRVRRAPTKTVKVAASPEAAWADSMRRAQGEAIPYAASGRYNVGNRVKHSRFGEGVVVRLSSATVCEVIFVTGTVKLVMGSSQVAR